MEESKRENNSKYNILCYVSRQDFIWLHNPSLNIWSKRLSRLDKERIETLVLEIAQKTGYLFAISSPRNIIAKCIQSCWIWVNAICIFNKSNYFLLFCAYQLSLIFCWIKQKCESDNVWIGNGKKIQMDAASKNCRLRS